MKKKINIIVILFACVLFLDSTSSYGITNSPVQKKIVSSKIVKGKPNVVPKVVPRIIPKSVAKTIPKVTPKSVEKIKPTVAPKPVEKVMPQKEKIKPQVVENKIASIDNLNVVTLKGMRYTLPDKISAKMSNGEYTEQLVFWDNKIAANEQAGVFFFNGSVKGYDKQVLLTLNIDEITKINDLNGMTGEDKSFKLPTQVEGAISNGTKDVFDVTWDMANIEKPETGTYIYSGYVSGYEGIVKYTLNRKIPEKVQEILGVLIKPGMTDFEKELAIHNYIISKTTYSIEKSSYSGEAFRDYDIIVNGKGYDYTAAFNRLLNGAGIECKFILGEKNNNNNWNASIWNLVKLDGSYYHVDIQSNYLRFSNGCGAITYKYLNLSDINIKTDHRWKESEYEPCVSQQNSINSLRNIEMDTKAKQIISQIITPHMSELQKEISIHNYVVENTRYDSEALNTILSKGVYIEDDSNSAYAALIKGKTMCVGYAEAIHKLLSMVGVESIVILGEAKDSKEVWLGHAWNLIKLDNEYYHLDATYNDPVNTNGDQVLRYSYFNLTDAIILKDHKWNSALYPLATGAKYNQTNLKLSEKDAKGNDIVIINNVNDLYNVFTSILNSHKNKLSVKILIYSDIYMDTIRNVFNNSNAVKYDGNYFDDDFGSRYYDINISY